MIKLILQPIRNYRLAVRHPELRILARDYLRTWLKGIALSVVLAPIYLPLAVVLLALRVTVWGATKLDDALYLGNYEWWPIPPVFHHLDYLHGKLFAAYEPYRKGKKSGFLSKTP